MNDLSPTGDRDELPREVLFSPLGDALVEIAGLSGEDWSSYAADKVGTWDDVVASPRFRSDLFRKPEMLVQAVRTLREDYDAEPTRCSLCGAGSNYDTNEHGPLCAPCLAKLPYGVTTAERSEAHTPESLLGLGGTGK